MNLAGYSMQLCRTQVLHYAVHFAFTFLEVLSPYRHVESGLLFHDFGHRFAVCVQMRICAWINKQSYASVSELNLWQHSDAGTWANMHFITLLGDLGFCKNILCKCGWIALYKHKTEPYLLSVLEF